MGAFGVGLQMAVDPNEPSYCSCNRVSFGDMVCCQNDNCPISWFHYECVSIPPGTNMEDQEWYCPACAEQQAASKRSKGGKESGSGGGGGASRSAGGAATATTVGVGDGVGGAQVVSR